MKRFIIATILCLIPNSSLAENQKPPWKQDLDQQFQERHKTQLDTLRGIKGFLIAVAGSGEAKKDLRDKVLNDVELKFRIAGIKVINIYEWAEKAEEVKKGLFTTFGVSLTISPEIADGYFSYYASVGVWDSVSVVRNKAERVCKTYEDDILGGAKDFDSVRTEVKDLVDKFLNVYLSANPKK